MIHYLPPQAEYRHCKLLLISLKFIAPLFQVALIKTRPPPICRVFFDLFTHTEFIRIYCMVAQQSLFKNMQKCTHAYFAFMENVLQPLHYQTNYIFLSQK